MPCARADALVVARRTCVKCLPGLVPVAAWLSARSGKALAMGKKNFYAVRVGRKPGIYKTW